MNYFNRILEETWLDNNGFAEENVNKIFDYYKKEPSCNDLRNNYKALIIAFNNNNLELFKYILDLNTKDKFNIVWFSGNNDKLFDKNKVDIYFEIIDKIKTKKFSNSKFDFTKITKENFKNSVFNYLISSDYHPEDYQYKIDKVFSFLNSESKIDKNEIFSSIVLYCHNSILESVFNYFNEQDKKTLIDYGLKMSAIFIANNHLVRASAIKFFKLKEKEFEVNDLKHELNMNKAHIKNKKI